MSHLAQFLHHSLWLNGEACDAGKFLDILKSEFTGPQGQVVCIRDANPLRFSLKYLFLLESGCYPILVATETPASQLERLVETQRASLWDGSTYRDSRSQNPPGAYACLTSGTTGDPKLSWHSVEGALINARAHAEHLGINRSNSLVQALPMSHAFGIVCYLWTALATGASLKFLTAFLTPASWGKFVEANSQVYLSPALARLVLKHKGALLCPRGISVGGGLFHADEFQELRKKFPSAKIYVTYGFTECGPRASSELVTDGFKDRSIGYALPGYELAVVAEGKLQRVGRGRLAVKSPSAKLNSKAEEFVDDFLLSSDEVEIFPDGRVHYFDRADDLLKVGGVSVYPSDILTAFHQLYPREEALVFKEAHAIYGEIPVLVVEREGGTERLIEELAPFLSTLQLPKKIVGLKSFPRNSFGKIDRKAVRSFL